MEDETTRISVSRSSGERAVIVFAGVGLQIGSVPAEEFVGTLARLRDTATVFFVVDKTRTWYNHSDVDIAGIINEQTAIAGITHSYAVGNSMGGFGAISFGPELTSCRKILAFSPQFSVHPSFAPFERRWAPHREKITRWTRETACSGAAGPPLLICAGGKDRSDNIHADKIVASYNGPSTVLLAPRCFHNIPAALKAKGMLGQFLEQALSGETADSGALLRRYLNDLPPAAGPEGIVRRSIVKVLNTFAGSQRRQRDG